MLKYKSTNSINKHLTVNFALWGSQYKFSRVLEVELAFFRNASYNFDTDFYGGDRVLTLKSDDFDADIYTIRCNYKKYIEAYNNNTYMKNLMCTFFYMYIQEDVNVHIPKMYQTSLLIYRGMRSYSENSTFSIEPLETFYVKDIQL